MVGRLLSCWDIFRGYVKLQVGIYRRNMKPPNDNETLGEGELWIIRLSSIVIQAESKKRIEETFP